MKNAEEVKVIIFDLDGTMYQQETFHRLYLAYALEGSMWEKEYDRLLLGMEEIFSNQALFKMGHYYTNVDQEYETVEEVLDFTGSETLSDEESFIYGGDAWSLLNILTARLGIDENKRRSAFIRVRKQMLGGEESIISSQTLTAAIKNLEYIKRKVLMTNTHAQSGHEFIEYLNITSLFDEIYLDAKKPDGMQEVIKSLLIREKVQPHEILSIGDHPWNDLLPAKKLGCKTLLVTPFQLADPSQWDGVVTSSDELAVVLMELTKSKQKEREVLQ
ncbi:HAD family hydrolase [Jeotgalibacillus campisalis]|uniref:HAD family hydrolase n=1 Tax=Jeotgalibacillus campisalis TaxID=220754 RepID=A0A0C2V206_9BACL|nr:HAD family hydrolase [Jeotgalibacillus campisalis]KIL43077.1 hypothetical protein KR50_34800 [Jeotgalibacillus campisalis]